MHEILRGLKPGSSVLDLGSGSGSFVSSSLDVTRVDIDPGGDLCADAAALPFRDGAFEAIISNHSLEHIVHLEEALLEIGRVVRPGGALYVAVPDASTLCDRIYRWAASGGGHVNPFVDADDLGARIAASTGLPFRGSRVLHTSLSYLNRHNVKGWAGLRWFAFGAGNETLLRWWSRLARWSDRQFATRLSVYGWALYFGEIPGEIDTQPWTNVCVRCGAGHHDDSLRVARGRWVCSCGAVNFYSPSIY